jgi:ureidoglycolate lyase
VIKAVRLSAEAFAPFGQVLEGGGATIERKAFAARMHNGRAHARPNMTYMKIAPAVAAIRIEVLERHVHSNQTFIPLNGTRHLVVACPSLADGRPVVTELRAFVAEGGQAINYDANVWHAPRTALCAPGEFVMFRWDDGSELDTETFALDQAVTVDVAVR